MSTLIIAEADAQGLRPAIFNVVTAARKLGAVIDILIMSSDAGPAAKAAASIPEVANVLRASAPQFAQPTAEDLAAQALALIGDKHYTHVLAAANGFGKNAMPRIAAKLDVAQVSDITGVESTDTFVRPIYAGNAFATVKSNDPVKVVTVRPTAFDAAPTSGGNAAILDVTAVPPFGKSRVVAQELTKLERPELTSARVVISGGRGLGSGENFRMLEPLADKLHAALGASRAAVDAGYVPNDYQVGQTGKIVAPDLYIAVGISGAIQHLAGMKDSKVIVAINKDPDAPIFQIADYGLVGDLFEIIPQLTAAV
jgi:electron transfer flavoprotein alpha subunit